MKLILASILCLLFACTPESNWESATKTEVAANVGVYETQYLTLRKKALNGGNAQDKFDAFIFFYEHANQLEDYLLEAIEFLVESVEAKNTVAEYNLGYLLQTGTLVEEDKDAALHLFKRAAEKDHLRAQLWCGWNLQARYFAAKDGADRLIYFAEIEKWMRKAIASEYQDSEEVTAAKHTLGLIFVSESVQNEEGWQLLQEAVLAGYEPALIILKNMKEHLEKEVSTGFDDSRQILINLNTFLEEYEASLKQ